MPGSLTMEPIFCVQQLIETFREKKRHLVMAFIDLEKTYYGAWRVAVLERVTTVYVKIIQDIIYEARTSVKSNSEIMGKLTVTNSVHQRTALNPYLFLLLWMSLWKVYKMK